MKVLSIGGLVPWHPSAGGGQVIALKQAQALARAGHEVHYIAHAPSSMRRACSGARVSYVPAPNSLSQAITQGLAVLKQLSAQDYDIIHIHGAWDTLGYFAAAAIKRLRNQRLRLVLGLYPPLAYSLPRSPTELMWMILGRLADRIHALSQFSKENLARAYSLERGRIDVVYGGADDGFFSVGENRAEGGPPSGRLLFCGRLTGTLVGRRQQKGLDILLNAISLVPTSQQPSLTVIGGGSRLDEYRAYASGLGVADRVEFVGFVEHDRMPEHYEGASIFMLPSRRESFGLVLVEAMASGLPVIAARVGAVSEVVRDGETGFLVPPEVPAALARAIERMSASRELMNEMGRKGHARARRLFTWGKVAERVAASYETCR